MLSEASQGLRRDSRPEETEVMTVDRPAVKPAGVISRLIEAIPIWKRAEVRLTWAHTDATIEKISHGLDLDMEAAHLLSRTNPLDDYQRHRAMPRGTDGVKFAREAMSYECRMSGSAEIIHERWADVIDEIKAKSESNNLIDVASLTPDIDSARQSIGYLSSKISLAERTAVRLAYACNADINMDDIANAFSLDRGTVSHLTRNDIGSSANMNRGKLGIKQAKDLFFRDQVAVRGPEVRDGRLWTECLIQARQLKNKLLESLDWRLVDTLAKSGGQSNPLLIELGAK